MTLPEVLLWDALRGRRLGQLRFRRQHPIGSYILDFYCASAKLAVEIDGSAHDNPQRIRHDAARDAWLRSQGISVLRFDAKDVLDSTGIESVVTAIRSSASAPSTAFGGPPPPLRGGGL